MRLTACLPLAIISAALCAATRPHYGGTLRVQVRAIAVDAPPLASLVSEGLVRLDDSGAPQPSLALSWSHDGNGKRWQFNLRTGVKLHDGSPLTPESIAAALPDFAPIPNGNSVILRAEHGIAALLLDLAHHNFAETGPFRLTSFDPGHHGTFAAYPDYWGGRPFLDAIEVQLGRPLRDQLTDLELARTDIAEITPADLRRASEHSWSPWSSAPVNLIAVAFAPGRAEDPQLREALALAIDRAALHDVLLQKQGESTAALLPQWLSGYAFAFSTARDVARARTLAGGRALAMSYDPALPAGRNIADRIAVNAHDAGLTVQVAPPSAPADARLLEVRVHSLDPWRALAGLAEALGLEPPAPAVTPTGLYESEHNLLETDRVIPLIVLPDLYGVAARVRIAAPPAITRLGEWRFENVWIAP